MDAFLEDRNVALRTMTSTNMSSHVETSMPRNDQLKTDAAMSITVHGDFRDRLQIKRPSYPVGDKMSSVFASLDEAFNGPANPGKHKKKRAGKDVPGALGGSPDPDRPAEIPTVDPMSPPLESVGSGHPEAAIAQSNFFPLPGETAEPEEWSKAFMLEPSKIPQFRADGSAPVNGKSTLWRKVPVPPPTEAKPADSDVYKRLDALTKQLEALTHVKPMQSTAELFLFVAIGLLFLLAIDTLLRFATTIAVGRRLMSGGRRLLNRRWVK